MVSEGPDNVARAERAVRRFRKMQPTLNAFARTLTGKSSISVVAGSASMTDGRKITILPPLELGDDLNHQRSLCDLRDEHELLICNACLANEDTMQEVYHEISHIAYGSFGTDGAHVSLATLLRRSSIPQDVAKVISDKADRAIRASYSREPDVKSVSNAINPFLPLIFNALEDVRVDSRMHEAREGTRVMRRAARSRVMREGFHKPDGSVFMWSDAPLNAQVAVGLVLAGSGEGLEHLHPLVEEVVSKTPIKALARRAADSSGPMQVLALGIEVLYIGQGLGLFMSEKNSENFNSPEEEEPENEGAAEDGSEGDSGDGSDASGGPGERDSDPSERGAPEERTEAAGDPREGDGGREEREADPDGGAEAIPGDEASPKEVQGSGEDQSDASPSGGDGVKQDDDATDPAEDGGEDSSDGMGDSAGEVGEALPSGDDSAPVSSPSGEEGSPEGDESGGDEEDSESTREGGSESESTSASGGSREEATNLSVGAGSSDPGENPDDVRGDEDSVWAEEEVEQLAGGSDEVPSSGRDDIGDGELAPGDNEGERAAEGGDGGAETEDAPASDLLEDYELAPLVIPDDVDLGSRFDIESNVTEVLGHKEFESSASTNVDSESVKGALRYMDDFESASVALAGVKVKSPNTGHSDYISKIPGFIDEAIVGKSILEMRRSLEENRRSKMDRNRRSGRVSSRVLGRRAWGDDDRLFHKRAVPGKRDYAVLIGVDVSGSTAAEIETPEGRMTLCTLAIRAAYAQAEVCNRLGVKFAVYAHTGTHSSLVIYDIKKFDTPWTNEARSKLMALEPTWANYDGHTMEYYRKRLDEVKATDKILMYYSDGAMPLENYKEELAILKTEIKTCRDKGYTLMAVGVGCTDPRQHGLDTVRIDGLEDIPSVVKHLGKRIMQPLT